MGYVWKLRRQIPVGQSTGCSAVNAIVYLSIVLMPELLTADHSWLYANTIGHFYSTTPQIEGWVPYFGTQWKQKLSLYDCTCKEAEMF